MESQYTHSLMGFRLAYIVLTVLFACLTYSNKSCVKETKLPIAIGSFLVSMLQFSRFDIATSAAAVEEEAKMNKAHRQTACMRFSYDNLVLTERNNCLL